MTVLLNEHPVAAPDIISVDSTPLTTSPTDGGMYDKSLNNNNRVDSFSHVYCDYLSQNDVPDLMCTGDPSSISIFHSNVISLEKNLDGVEEVFSNCKNYPSIIAISETGLDDDTESEQVKLNGYHKLEREDSPTCKGGVGVYVTEQLDYELRDDLKLKVDDCEDIWLEVQAIPDESQGGKKVVKSFVVGVIYHHLIDPLTRSHTSYAKILKN